MVGQYDISVTMPVVEGFFLKLRQSDGEGILLKKSLSILKRPINTGEICQLDVENILFNLCQN